MPSPPHLYEALVGLFPDLDLTGLSPLASGWASEVYRTEGDLVVRVGKHWLARGSYALERDLMPLLASRLPVEVAQVTHLAPPSERFPFGVAVHRMIEGAPASATEMTAEVAGELGRFFAALHRVPAERAREGGVRALDAAGESLAWAEAVAPVIEDGQVREALDAWLAGVREGTRYGGGPLVLCHFDAWCENLLLRKGRLAAVLDFGDATLAPPAAELAAISYYPPTFSGAVIEAYRAAGGILPDDWPSQARDYLIYRELRGLHGAVTESPGELPDSLRKLRTALVEYAPSQV